MTKDPNEIHFRINVARKLAEKLEHQERNSSSIGGIEAGLASYLLLSSLDHLMWWASVASKRHHADTNVYSSIHFGNANCEKWVKKCNLWLGEPYLSRILSVSRLASTRKNHKWLKTLANQDKHKYTAVIQDESTLNYVKEKLIEAAKFIDYSVRHVKEGIPLPSEFRDNEEITNKVNKSADIARLEMLIHERIEYSKRSIIELETAVQEYLGARRDSAKIINELDSNEKFRLKVSARNMPAPIEWSVKTSLIGHLLRSVLDHIVWALVVRSGKKPKSRIKFPIPEPKGCTDKRINQMLKNLPSDIGQKIKGMLDPMHPFMGGAYADLISLDCLRKTDAHRHVPIAISRLSGISDEWNNRASEALERGEHPPDATPDDVEFFACFVDQTPADRPIRYRGNVIQFCYDSLTAVNSVAEYLDFNRGVAK